MAVVDYIYDTNGNATEIDCLFEELPIFYRITTTDGDESIEEPFDWPDVPITHKRSKDYHGFNYEFMGEDIKLKFGRDSGLTQIRAEYDLNGNDGEAILTQYTVWNEDEYVLYEGKLDLNDLVREDYYVSCVVKRKSIHEKIMSRMDTTLKFAEWKDLDNNVIPNPTLTGIKMLSRVLLETFKSRKIKFEEVEHVQKQSEPIVARIFFNTQVEANNNNPEMVTENQDVNTIAGYEGTVAGISSDQNMAYFNSVFTFENNGTFTIKADVLFSLFSEIGPRNSTFSRKDIEGYQVSTFIVHWAGGWDGEGLPSSYLKESYPLHDPVIVTVEDPTRSITTGNISGYIDDLEIEVEAGDKLVLMSELVIDVQPNPGTKLLSQVTRMSQTKAILELTGSSEMPETNHNSILIKKAINYCFHKILGFTDNVVSDFYSKEDDGVLVDGCGANRILIGGRNLRIRGYDGWGGFGTLDMSISLKNLYNSLDAIDCIGMGYEWDEAEEKELIRIEPRSYFYKDEEVFEFVDITKFRQETAKEYIYNNLEIGYEKFNEDLVNSLDEAHAYHEYQTPITSNENKLVVKSKMIASGYIAEVTRRQAFKIEEKQATVYDDDVFTVDVTYFPEVEFPFTSYIPLTDQPFASVTGTLSPDTTYNLLHTPKRMLIAWARWIKSCLVYKGTSSVIKNTFTKQNRDLSTVLAEDWDCSLGDDFKTIVKEDSDVILANYSEQDGIFSPEWVFFSVILTNSEVRYIINAHRGMSEDENNYGYISYTDDDGVKRKAYLYELSYNRMTHEAEIKALKKKFP